MQPSLCCRDDLLLLDQHLYLDSLLLHHRNTTSSDGISLYFRVFSFPIYPVLHSPGLVSTSSYPNYEELQLKTMQEPR